MINHSVGIVTGSFSCCTLAIVLPFCFGYRMPLHQTTLFPLYPESTRYRCIINFLIYPVWKQTDFLSALLIYYLERMKVKFFLVMQPYPDLIIMHGTTFQALQYEKAWKTAIANKEKLNPWIGFHQEILTLTSTTRGLKCHTINYHLIYSGAHYGCEWRWANWTELSNSLGYRLYYQRTLDMNHSSRIKLGFKFPQATEKWNFLFFILLFYFE